MVFPLWIKTVQVAAATPPPHVDPQNLRSARARIRPRTVVQDLGKLHYLVFASVVVPGPQPVGLVMPGGSSSEQSRRKIMRNTSLPPLST